MLKRFICAFLALIMCVGTVMLTVACADKTSDSTTADTGVQTPEDTETEKETEGEEDMQNKPTASIADLTPSNGKKLKIAFIGDSITQGTGTTNEKTESYPAQLQALLDRTKYQIGNFGRASAYTLAAKSKYNYWASAKPDLSYKDTQEYKNSLAFEADVVVIMLGTNDMRSMTCKEARDEFKASLADLCKIYGEQESVQKVYIATSLHVVSNFMAIQMSSGEIQELQRECAAEQGIELLDIYSLTRDYTNVMLHYSKDRLHPNKEIYSTIAHVYKALLFGEQYSVPEAPKAQSDVVYVKASGSATADGTSPEKAVNHLSVAVGLLRETGGCVVICGAYSVNYEMHLPENKKPITVTSKYNGVDYAAEGAKLGIAARLSLYGDFIFENIKINVEHSSPLISCGYNNVTFGDGIVSTSSQGNTYPIIMCGYTIDSSCMSETVSLKGECNITFNSGKWSYLNGGNRRSKGTLSVGSSDKDAVLNITVNGGEFVLESGSNLNCAIGMNSFAGTCNFTVNGGSFAGNLYAVGRIGQNTTADPSEMSGTVNMIINGGTFAKIIATQDSTSKITGNINITIPAALESSIVGFTNVTKK